ncbi:hypothetical protein B0T25DRAFT_197782 [Lasiosphaeria hispida]|uniref:Developmental regulator protein n=1 Tax=Lasiosphaeria hispida TaxID=260671 RepID=A0AAJ0MDZ8_9PEZI|nr:hypothetical protein B0T25DRAFT_197782 [Lasiosphaeria hispida]
MPTYLCHGFRWQRRSIRVYVVVQNLDDASPEWIIPGKSSQCILESFYNLFDFLPYCSPSNRGNPSSSIDSDDESYIFQTSGASGGRSRSQSVAAQSQRSRSQSQSQSMGNRSRSRSRQPSQGQRSQQQLTGGESHGGTSDEDFKAQDWSVVKVLEEYDPLNLEEVSRPYAYVADYVVRVDLSVSIAEEMRRYEEQARADHNPPMTGHASDETGGRRKINKRPGWFEKLRDQLQRGEEIRWYVVVNGDEVRDWPNEPERRYEPRRPTPTRGQKQHHAQYQHQQAIFEQNERERKKDQGGVSRFRPADRKPTVPEKDFPALKPKMSLDGSGLRPKTPSKGGFRRLFGRSKPDESYSP